MPYNYIFDSIRLLSAPVMNMVGIQTGLWLCWQIFMVVLFVPLEDWQLNLTDPKAVWFCDWLAGRAFMLNPAGS